jgi:hypothetical protein
MISIVNANYKIIDITETQDVDFIIPHASSTINNTIVINDLSGYPQNWTWAKAQGICTGSGTEKIPI